MNFPWHSKKKKKASIFHFFPLKAIAKCYPRDIVNENVSSSGNFDHRPLTAPSTLMFINDFSKIFPVYKQARTKGSGFFGWQSIKNLIPASDNLPQCWWQNVLKQSVTLGHAQPPHIVGQDETTNLVIKSCAGWSSSCLIKRAHLILCLTSELMQK